jgi:hypothetical protein
MKCRQQVNSFQLLDRFAALAAAAIQSEGKPICGTIIDAEEAALPQDFANRIYSSGQRVYRVMNCQAFMGMVVV